MRGSQGRLDRLLNHTTRSWINQHTHVMGALATVVLAYEYASLSIVHLNSERSINRLLIMRPQSFVVERQTHRLA